MKEIDNEISNIKYSANKNFIKNRIYEIEHTPVFVDKDKELYFLEFFCTEERIGTENENLKNLYKVSIDYSELKKNKISALAILTSCRELFFSEVSEEFKPSIEMLIEITFLYYKESKNENEVLKLYEFTQKGNTNFKLPFYQYMVETNFSTEKLNPVKYICDMWNELHKETDEKCSYETPMETIAKVIGLDVLETQKLLQENRQFLFSAEDLDFDWKTELERRELEDEW